MHSRTVILQARSLSTRTTCACCVIRAASNDVSFLRGCSVMELFVPRTFPGPGTC